MAWAGDKGEGLLQLSFGCSCSASAVTDRPSRWPEEVPADRHKLVRAIPVLPRGKLACSHVRTPVGIALGTVPQDWDCNFCGLC